MSMADRDGVIWMDGELVPWREAKIHVLTHTLHYGMGVFEGVRAYKTDRGTAIFRLQEHTDRLFGSAHIMMMKVVQDKAEMNEAQKTVVRENGLETAYIRPLFFYGSEGMGLRADNLRVHAAVAAWVNASDSPPDVLHLNDWHTAAALGLVSSAVPTVLNDILHNASDADLSSLRGIVCGGSASARNTSGSSVPANTQVRG